MTELAWVANPWAVVLHFHRHRFLLAQLARREVQTRWRGSWLGPFWSLLTPLLLLAVYTFVFSVVFQARWSQESGAGRLDFVLALFSSLTAFQIFSETVAAAPRMIAGNPNYVKRVVFPLEILPVVHLLSNLVQAGLGFAVFLAVMLAVQGSIPWTIVLLPVVLLPLCLLALGCAYCLSGLGVFVRDVNHVIGLAITMLMFMSAVFYPLSALPPAWQPILALNPLVSILEDVRRVCLAGLPPQWLGWSAVTAFSLAAALAGLFGFLRARAAFADYL